MSWVIEVDDIVGLPRATSIYPDHCVCYLGRSFTLICPLFGFRCLLFDGFELRFLGSNPSLSCVCKLLQCGF